MKTNSQADTGVRRFGTQTKLDNLKNALLATAGLIAILCIQPLSATSRTPLTDQELVKNAEFIFQGSVVRIDNRMSRFRTVSESAVPHVFVTFQVEKIFKGTHTGQSNQFTVRFLGGADSTARRFMRVEGCPDFDIGEKVVLFVRRNESSVCPIAGWSQGRLRIVDGEIFSDTGREVWLSPAGKLTLGREHDLREVRTHHRGGKIFAYRVDGGGPSANSVPELPMAGTRLTPIGFINLVSRMVSVLHSPSELSRLAAVKGAVPDEPFYFTQPRAVGDSTPQK